MKRSLYTLAGVLLVGTPVPAYAHGEQIAWIIYSHVLTLIGVPLILQVCRLQYLQKVIAFMGLLLGIVAMWVLPVSREFVEFMVFDNPIVCILTWIGVPLFIAAFALYVSIRIPKKANKSLHRTREEHARR